MINFEVKHIRTDLIDRHPWNRELSPVPKSEFLEDIRTNGIETPLSLRAIDGGRYQLIKGERRLIAAKALGMTEVPCFVASLNDVGAYLSLLRDNLQREQLSPMQEAVSYERLLKMPDDGGEPFTVDRISKKVGVDKDTIYRRMKLMNLTPDAASALEAGGISERVAFYLGRSPESLRAAITKDVLTPVDNYTNKRVDKPLNVTQTEELIERKYLISLQGVAFDLDDATLTPDLGACTTCPWLAKNNLAFADELGGAKVGGKRGKEAGLSPLTCTNPDHYRLKLAAYGKRRLTGAVKEGKEALSAGQVAEIYHLNGNLNYNSTLEKLSGKPGYDELGHYDGSKVPTWAQLVKEAAKQDIQIPIKVAINPKSGEVDELAVRKALVELARKVRPELFKKGRKSSDQNSPEQVAARAEVEKKKLMHATGRLGLARLREALDEKGIGIEEQAMIFQSALEHAGADGAKLMADFLAVPKPAKFGSNHEWSPLIVAHIMQAGPTKAHLETLTVLALLASGVRWQGAETEDFVLWAKHCSLDLKLIHQDAKRLSKKPDKAKGKPEDAAPKSVSRSEAVKRNDEAVDRGERSRLGMWGDDDPQPEVSRECAHCQTIVQGSQEFFDEHVKKCCKKKHALKCPTLNDDEAAKHRASITVGALDPKVLEKPTTKERVAAPEAEAIAFAKWKDTRSIKEAAEAAGVAVDTVKNWHKRRKWAAQRKEAKK